MSEARVEAVPPLLLTPEQAGEVLGGVKRSLVYELINAGEIETVKIRSSRKVVYASLVAYVQRLREQGQGAA
jgi:excisionase family DNA binding protein